MLNIGTTSNYYTYRLVGHVLCHYDNSSHTTVVGMGDVLGLNSITSVLSSNNIPRSIQHELTHNLGGSHSTCTTGQLCVLKGNMGYWCDDCKANILNNL